MKYLITFLFCLLSINALCQSIDDIDFSSEEAVIEYFKKQGTTDPIEGIWVYSSGKTYYKLAILGAGNNFIACKSSA